MPPGTIQPELVAVLRGRVLDVDGHGVPSVRISVVDHPEFGHTVSRMDGGFDLAVNGGEVLVIEFSRPEFMTLQRHEDVPWQEFVDVADVVLTRYDTKVTTVDTDLGDPFQVASGTPQTDADGTRQATLLFAKGTDAVMELPDGSTQPLDDLAVRATEYTVGASGDEAMPGELPATSAYTYAVEFSVDEAVAAGATDVRFDKPVINYVDNFLGFPAGTVVPTAYYDRERGVWVPSKNGIVLKILDIVAGVAIVDTDGDGAADSRERLAQLGITDDERKELGKRFAIGATLWRVLIRHFTPWDHNWPYGCKALCPPPDEPPPPDPPCPECEGGGSTIGFLNQTLGEELPLIGTPFSLQYTSDRLPGYTAADSVDIPLSGASAPGNLLGISLQVNVAGQNHALGFAPGANLTHSFTWNGKDAYQRPVQGAQLANVRIGYVYEAVYLEPLEFAASFAQFGGRPLSADQARREITVWQEWQRPLGAFGIGSEALGGWTVDVHHSYDPQGKVLYFGDGTRRTAEAIKSEIRSVAGISYLLGGQTPATQTHLGHVRGVDVAPDGGFYIAGTELGVVWKVTRAGEIAVVAGGGDPADGLGDGGPATEAQLVAPSDVEAAPDGGFFISDTGNGRIRYVDEAGMIRTSAGGGEQGVLGDDGPATSAFLDTPRGIALGIDGTLFVADAGNDLVRRVTSDGRITTAAGGGSPADGLGDGGLATEAALDLPLDVAIDSAGDLLVADGLHHRVRVVRSTGRIETKAGNGGAGNSGDGGRATEAEIGLPQGIDASRDGTLLIADRLHHVVRRVTSDGFIGTGAGTGQAGSEGDGGSPQRAQLPFPQDVAAAPDGSFLIVDGGNQTIRRAATSLPGFSDADLTLPSEDGTELYLFTDSGRHLRTLDALTGAMNYAFEYDAKNRLISITDGDSNTKTQIERAADGTALAIVAPGGQRTELTVGAGGYLTSVKNPAGEQTQMSYTAGGLLTTMTEPGGAAHFYEYDALGRLVRDQDPDGGFQTLSRTDTRTSSTVKARSGMGREAIYRTEVLPGGDRLRTVRRPSGATTTSVTDPGDGRLTVTYPDGTRRVMILGPDPRYGMRAPIVTSELFETPGGVRQQMTATREVILKSPDDLLSVDTMFDTATYDGDSFRVTTRAPGTMPGDPTDWTITTESAEGRQTVTTLDPRGRVIRRKNGTAGSGAAETVFTYDSLGRVAKIEQGVQSSTYTWDSLNRLVAEADAIPQQIEYTYDGADRVTGKRLAGGQLYQYGYDAAGNLTSLTMPSGAVHTFTPTPGRKLDGYGPPASTPFDWSYNDDGFVSGLHTPSLRTESYTYDAAGRLTAAAGPDTKDSFAYPGTGATDRIARMNRMATGGAMQDLEFSFDGVLLTSTRFSGSATGTFSYGPYNNDLLPTRIRLESGTDIVDTVLAYDRDDLLTRNGPFTLTRAGPAGAISKIVDTVPGLAVELEYDSLARLVRRTHTVKGSGVYRLELAYDSAGRISQRTETLGGGAPATRAYTYDANDRLIGVSGAASESYAYDANGNRTNGGATYDSQDRLTMLNGVPYLSDADGFLSGRGADTFHYSVDGALLSATVGGQTVTYAYDAVGRRVARTTAAGTHQYLYGGVGHEFQLAAVRAPSGELTRLYYDEADALFALERGGNRFYVAGDQVGSPRVVTDVNGAIVKQVEYDSFGGVLMDTAPSFDIPIGFAGGLADSLTGLVRFGRRDYDPAAGRWTAKDPIFFEGSGTNLYTYVDNDPVALRDPSGLGDLPFPPQGPSKYPYIPNVPKQGKPRSEYKETLKISKEGEKGVEEYKNPVRRLWEWCTSALGGGGDPPPPPPPGPKPPPPPPRELPQFQPGKK